MLPLSTVGVVDVDEDNEVEVDKVVVDDIEVEVEIEVDKVDKVDKVEVLRMGGRMSGLDSVVATSTFEFSSLSTPLMPPSYVSSVKSAIVSVVSSASLSLASVTNSVMSVISRRLVVSDAAPVALMLSVILVGSVTAFA